MAHVDYAKWQLWIERMIQRYLEQRRHHRNMIMLICRHPYLPLSFLEKFKKVSWDKSALQHHPAMTAKIFRKYIRNDSSFRPIRNYARVYFQGYRSYDFVQWERKPFRKTFLSYHPKLPLELVLKYPNMGWDFTFLLLYRKWTTRHIERLVQSRRMDWTLYSRNPYINAEDVRYFLRYPWDWVVLATHPSFPPDEMYHDNILFGKWKWRHVFKNPVISLKFWNELCCLASSPVSDEYIILHNRFQHDRFLRLWATLKIVSFCCHVCFRNTLNTKLKFVVDVKRKVCDDLFQNILSFV